MHLGPTVVMPAAHVVDEAAGADNDDARVNEDRRPATVACRAYQVGREFLRHQEEEDDFQHDSKDWERASCQEIRIHQAIACRDGDGAVEATWGCLASRDFLVEAWRACEGRGAAAVAPPSAGIVGARDLEH